MIETYKDRRTARFARGEPVKEFRQFAAAAETRLARLNDAKSLADLAAMPGNRLEALRGTRKGLHSIRINDQWRICFRWDDTNKSAEDVEIVDYHRG